VTAERARRVAGEFGDRVAYREIDTSDHGTVAEWGLADALLVDGKRVMTGPPLSPTASGRSWRSGWRGSEGRPAFPLRRRRAADDDRWSAGTPSSTSPPRARPATPCRAASTPGGSTWGACSRSPWICAARWSPSTCRGRFDLRLYTMAQASLAGTLLLCGALALLTAAPRLVLATLGANASSTCCSTRRRSSGATASTFSPPSPGA